MKTQFNLDLEPEETGFICFTILVAAILWMVSNGLIDPSTALAFTKTFAVLLK